MIRPAADHQTRQGGEFYFGTNAESSGGIDTRASPTSRPAVKPTTSAITNGWGSCWIAKPHGDRTSASRRGCASPNYASRPVSKTSTIAVPAVLTAPCSKNWSTANGSTSTTIWPSSARLASAKVGWRRRSATKRAATTDRSSISVSPGYSRTSRSRAATDAIRACCATWAAPICLFSMTGA